jgi:hypothetical protein
MADIKVILDPLPVPAEVKAQAWDAFSAVQTEGDFSARFDKLAIPKEAKAALWDAKFKPQVSVFANNAKEVITPKKLGVQVGAAPAAAPIPTPTTPASPAPVLSPGQEIVNATLGLMKQGVQDVGHGLQQALMPSMPPTASHVTNPTPTFDQRAGGVSQAIGGAMEATAPIALPLAAVTAGIPATVAGIAVGTGATILGTGAASAVGAGPGVSALLGDALGLWSGGKVAHWVTKSAKGRLPTEKVTSKVTFNEMRDTVTDPHELAKGVDLAPVEVPAQASFGGGVPMRVDTPLGQPPTPTAPRPNVDLAAIFGYGPGEQARPTPDLLVVREGVPMLVASEEEVAARVLRGAGLPDAPTAPTMPPHDRQMTVAPSTAPGDPTMPPPPAPPYDAITVPEPADTPQARITHAIQTFGRVTRNWLQIRQVGYEFPDVAPIQDFVAGGDRMSTLANQIKSMGAKVTEEWRKLGRTREKQLSEFHYDVTQVSYTRRKKFSAEELAARAKHEGLDDKTFEVFLQAQEFFVKSIEDLRSVTLEDAKARITDPAHLQVTLDAINRSFDGFKERTYFPLGRFGEFTVTARPPNGGETLVLETYETNREAKLAYEAMKKRFEGTDTVVVKDRLTPEQRESLRLPAVVRERLATALDLSPEQVRVMNDIAKNGVPSMSFVHHLRQRRGIEGFSRDGLRTFDSYVKSIANHTAKMKEERNIQAAIDAVDRIAAEVRRVGGDNVPTRNLHSWMVNSKKWMMNPRIVAAALSGAQFFWHFSYVPVQAFINLFQLPTFTYSHLAAQVGDKEAALALVRTMKNVTAAYTKRQFGANKQYEGRISPETWGAIERAQDEGVLADTFVKNVAAYAHAFSLERAAGFAFGESGAAASRYASRYTHWLIDKGTLPFQVSEQYNRIVTFVAQLELAKTQGFADPYKAAVDAVYKTQGSYEAWNRAPITRGMLGPLFVFKGYTMSSLYFFGRLPGQKRALVALAFMAGLQGLPGAENALDILDAMGSWGSEKLHVKNPRVDLRNTIREYVNEVLGSSDAVMHGVSRLPQSLFDVSANLSMGRIVPVVSPVSKMFKGEMRPDVGMLRIIEELTGVSGSKGMNMFKAAVEMNPDSAVFNRVMLPSALSNIDESYRAYRQGKVVAADGSKLIDIDPRDPVQLAEVLGMSMGLKPRRLSVAQELSYAPNDLKNYYKLREAMVKKQYELAILDGTDEEKKAAREAVLEHNRLVPHGFGILPKDTVQGKKARAKGRYLREHGLPSEKGLIEVYKSQREVIR